MLMRAPEPQPLKPLPVETSSSFDVNSNDTTAADQLVQDALLQEQQLAGKLAQYKRETAWMGNLETNTEDHPFARNVGGLALRAKRMHDMEEYYKARYGDARTEEDMREALDTRWAQRREAEVYGSDEANDLTKKSRHELEVEFVKALNHAEDTTRLRDIEKLFVTDYAKRVSKQFPKGDARKARKLFATKQAEKRLEELAELADEKGIDTVVKELEQKVASETMWQTIAARQKSGKAPEVKKAGTAFEPKEEPKTPEVPVTLKTSKTPDTLQATKPAGAPKRGLRLRPQNQSPSQAPKGTERHRRATREQGPTKPEKIEEPKKTEKTPEPEAKFGPLNLTVGQAEAKASYHHESQDFMLVDEQKKLFGVFDGMGSDPRSQLASSAAAHAIDEYYSLQPQPASVEDAIRQMKESFSAGRLAAQEVGSVTTAVVGRVVHIDGQDYLIAGNAGDSRMVLFRDGEIRNITEDQSSGHIIHNGFEPERPDWPRQPDQFVSLLLQPGDKILGCSDGITGDQAAEFLTSEEWQDAFSQPDAQAAANRFMELSKKDDDKTAFVVFSDQDTDGTIEPKVARGEETPHPGVFDTPEQYDTYLRAHPEARDHAAIFGPKFFAEARGASGKSPEGTHIGNEIESNPAPTKQENENDAFQNDFMDLLQDGTVFEDDLEKFFAEHNVSPEDQANFRAKSADDGVLIIDRPPAPVPAPKPTKAPESKGIDLSLLNTLGKGARLGRHDLPASVVSELVKLGAIKPVTPARWRQQTDQFGLPIVNGYKLQKSGYEIKQLFGQASGNKDDKPEAKAPEAPAKAKSMKRAVPEWMQGKPAAEYTKEDLRELSVDFNMARLAMDRAAATPRQDKKAPEVKKPVKAEDFERYIERIETDYQKALDTTEAGNGRRLVTGLLGVFDQLQPGMTQAEVEAAIRGNATLLGALPVQQDGDKASELMLLLQNAGVIGAVEVTDPTTGKTSEQVGIVKTPAQAQRANRFLRNVYAKFLDGVGEPVDKPAAPQRKVVIPKAYDPIERSGQGPYDGKVTVAASRVRGGAHR